MQQEWRSLPDQDLATFTALLAIRDEINQVHAWLSPKPLTSNRAALIGICPVPCATGIHSEMH